MQPKEPVKSVKPIDRNTYLHGRPDNPIEQTRFIGNIKKALNRTNADQRRLEDLIQTSPDDDDTRLMKTIHGRDQNMRLALLDSMMVVAKTINTKVVAWDDPLVNGLNLSAAMQPLGVPVYFPEDDSRRAAAETFRRRSETALIGVSSADFALAETATLTMKTRLADPCTFLCYRPFTSPLSVWSRSSPTSRSFTPCSNGTLNKRPRASPTP
jgi:hypothetical protein